MQFAPDDFRRTVLAHQSMVYSIALRITCDAGTAEEVAQDAFLALHRSAEQVAGPEHLRFWLRRTTTHAAIDALRRQSRQPEARAEQWDEDSGSPGPGDSLSQLALEARLDELLATLPEAMRVAVVLRYTEGMKPEEMATLLGQPLATVKSNLQRGLSLLRRKAAVTLKEYVR